MIAITVVIVAAVLALALPVATGVRHAVMPRLAPVVLVLGAVTGAWQLGAGIVQAVSRGAVGRESSVSLLLGASAICMASAFLPSAEHAAPRLVPMVLSALFACAAALLSRALRARAQH